MNVKNLAIGLGLGVMTLTGAGIGLNAYGNNMMVNDCNAGDVTACEFIVDDRPTLRTELSEKGENNVLDLLDDRRRNGEDLSEDYTRQITPDDKVTGDIKYTSVATPTAENSVVIHVRWVDGVKRNYLFNADGTGWSWNPEGNTRASDNHQWEIDEEGNVKVTSEHGWITMFGQFGSEMTSLQAESVEKTRAWAEAERAAEEARLEEERYLVETGVRVLGGIFGF